MTIYEQFKLAKDKDTDQDKLRELALSEHESVRSCIANNESTPYDVLEEFVKDTEKVQIYLALNNNCPVDVLTKLSMSNSEILRNYVSSHKNCPQIIINKYFEEEDALMGISSNPSAPSEILEKLYSMDYGAYVEFLVMNIATPKKILKLIALSLHDEIKLDLARNTSCTDEIFDILIKCGLLDVKKAILNNKSISYNTLHILSEDSNPYISLQATKELIGKRSMKEISEELSRRLDPMPNGKIDEFMLM